MIDFSLLKIGIGFIIACISARLVSPSLCKKFVAFYGVSYFLLDYFIIVNSISESSFWITMMFICLIMWATFEFLPDDQFPPAAHKVESLNRVIEKLETIQNEIQCLKLGQQHLEGIVKSIRKEMSTKDQLIDITDTFQTNLQEWELSKAKQDDLISANCDYVEQMEVKIDKMAESLNRVIEKSETTQNEIQCLKLGQQHLEGIVKSIRKEMSTKDQLIDITENFQTNRQGRELYKAHQDDLTSANCTYIE